MDFNFANDSAHVCLAGEKAVPSFAVLETTLTDITEGICTGGPGRTGIVCPFARCMTSGREPVGDLEKQKLSAHMLIQVYTVQSRHWLETLPEPTKIQVSSKLVHITCDVHKC